MFVFHAIPLEAAPVAVEENTQASNDDDAASSTPPPSTQSQQQSKSGSATATSTAGGAANASRENEASPDNGKSPTNAERNEEQGDTPRDGDQSRAETPHDESDYEDNITVTVPKPHSHSSTNNYHDYRDRQSGMNGRYTRPNINDMESASNQTQSHQVSAFEKSQNVAEEFDCKFGFSSV